MIQYFSFRTADGSAVSKSFAVNPLVYPLASGSKVIVSNPLYSLYSPQSLDMVPSIYQLRVKSQSDSIFYINVSASLSSTASVNIVSGSVISITGSSYFRITEDEDRRTLENGTYRVIESSYTYGPYSNVCFNFADFLQSSSVNTVEIKPIYKNVGFNDAFILTDTLTYSTDGEGSIIVPLIPMPYMVTFKGSHKSFPFQILPSGSNCTASNCIIANVYPSNIKIPSAKLTYGSYPFTASIPFQSTSSAYFQTKYFQFTLADGTPVSDNFSVAPVNYPLSSGSIILTSDPIEMVGSVEAQPMEMASNVYKIECNRKASNDWYISTVNAASPTASACIISGSYSTGSLARVFFDIADFEHTPLAATKINITPVYSNVGYNSFILRDTLVYYSDASGKATINLVPQPYNIEICGNVKRTKLSILPSGSCTASAIVVSGFNVSKVITPQNSANFSYTAQASDLRYLHYTGSIVYYTASNAMLAQSASYVPNLYPQIVQSTVDSASWVSASVHIKNSDTASYVASASWSSASLSASYALVISQSQLGPFSITDPTNVATLRLIGNPDTGGKTATIQSIPSGMSIFVDGNGFIGIGNEIHIGDNDIVPNDGQFLGTASYALSSSCAQTAINATNAQTAVRATNATNADVASTANTIVTIGVSDSNNYLIAMTNGASVLWDSSATFGYVPDIKTLNVVNIQATSVTASLQGTSSYAISASWSPNQADYDSVICIESASYAELTPVRGTLYFVYDAHFRITEIGDIRITEDGLFRIIE